MITSSIRGSLSAFSFLSLFSLAASASAAVLFEDNFNREASATVIGQTSTGNYQWESAVFDVTTAGASQYGISATGGFRITAGGGQHDPGIAWVAYDLKSTPQYTYSFDFSFPVSTNSAASFLIIPRLSGGVIPGNAAFVLRTSGAPSATVPATYSVYDYRGAALDGTTQMHIATANLTNLTSSGALPARPLDTVPIHRAIVTVDGDVATLTINGNLVGSINLLPHQEAFPSHLSFGYIANGAQNRAMNLEVDNLTVSSGLPSLQGFGAFMDAFTALTDEEKAPDADPDGDGISNLLEYALEGFSPDVPNALPSLADGTVTFTKRPLAVTNADLQYVIETSTTLGADPSPWTAVTASPDTTTTIGYTLPVDSPRNFLRLRVNLAN